MKLTLIQSPYDSGHYSVRMGRGPLHLVESGVLDWLHASGHEADLVTAQLPEGFATEVGSAVAIQRQVAAAAASARQEGRLPLLLAGNCNATLGLLAGIGSQNTGLLWFDAHGDFNTPETTLSGYFDGMALAMIAGLCWRELAASVPGFSPLDLSDVVLVGAFNLDPGEESLLDEHKVARFGALDLRQEGVAAVSKRSFASLQGRVIRLVVHVDLDVLDKDVARVNEYSSQGGLNVDEVIAVIKEASRRFVIAGVTLSAYDPDYDEGNKALHAVKKILDNLLG